MRADLEKYLWKRIRVLGAVSYSDDELPRTIIADMKQQGLIQSEKQAWRTLEKWTRRGAYNYGVTLDLGWREREEVEVCLAVMIVS
jgi:hypothetical protein